MRLALSPLGVVSAGVVVLATVAAGVSPASAAWESDYGARTTVTFGDNVHAQMPVSLDLPAPATGGALTSVVVRWPEQIPQSGSSTTTVSKALNTSTCTADAVCHLDTVVPTARIRNGAASITFVMSNSEGTVNFFNRTVAVQNPKPTVTFTAPEQNAALWGDVTLAAEATPSAAPGASALAGVRFYIDGNLAADAQYLFDTTPPYAVTVPATDIAPVLSSRYLVAVAEDADGNLSQMPTTGATTAVRRLVTVGPPPVVSWKAPTDPNTASGSVQGGVTLGYHAELPSTAPARPGQPGDPYISKVETLLDGTSLGQSSYTDYTPWNGYQRGAKLRTVDAYAYLTQDRGLTAGRHELTVRVTTSYGSVADASTDILVSDGVTWTGPVTSGGRVVRDGYVVTAGTIHRFQVPVATTVAGTRLVWAGMQISDQNLLTRYTPCPTSDPASCPGSTVIRGDDWAAPNAPGTHTLEILAQADGDATDILTRTILVQPAARLSLDVSSHLVRAGRSVGLTGRLTRRDTQRAQSGRTVLVQWLRTNRTAWKTVATRTTDVNGLIRLRLRPTANGYYRLRSPEVRGTLGPGQSPAQKVFVRR